jgi:hypothetical protein
MAFLGAILTVHRVQANDRRGGTASAPEPLMRDPRPPGRGSFVSTSSRVPRPAGGVLARGSGPKTLTASLADAARLLHQRGIRHLPVHVTVVHGMATLKGACRGGASLANSSRWSTRSTAWWSWGTASAGSPTTPSGWRPSRGVAVAGTPSSRSATRTRTAYRTTSTAAGSRSSIVTCANGLAPASAVTLHPRLFRLVPRGRASGGGKPAGSPAAGQARRPRAWSSRRRSRLLGRPAPQSR